MLHLLYARHNGMHVKQKIPLLTHLSILHYPKKLGDPGAFFICKCKMSIDISLG
uniref:Uncharacterized protein n=1 Tax=Anguilla anguilla TaxID=7936 RepID=A0A0E9X7H4_ANGAN